MFAHAFRFDPLKNGFGAAAFQARMRTAFTPRKPRHRALRVVLGLVGVALLAALVMLGLFVGAAMIAVGVGYRLWKQRGKAAARVGVRGATLDGQYRVVSERAPLSLPR
jgi:hypothetical protein